jgi:CRISPR-associated protein Cmr2
MAEYLFLVSIGPVQDFIASARRSRDLHFGSWLLSELARAAARQIVKENGLLIFPSPKEKEMLEPGQRFNVANKIVALIQQPPNESDDQGKHIDDRVYDAIIDRLNKISKEAYQNISFPESNRKIAEAQIKDLVEFIWVILPYKEGDYERTRYQLEILMTARKNTRNFKHVTWGDYVPKSSIDGQLESVIPEVEYPPRRASEADKLAKIRQLYINYGAGPAERLSGVDLLKRHGTTPFGSRFPSTSHIATLPFLKRIKILKDQILVKDAWNKYIGILQNLAVPQQLEQIPDSYPSHPILGKYEGSMLLEDRLVDILYMPASDPTRNTRLQNAKNALRDFYKVLDNQFTAISISKARPNPYYALLQADGDGMGAVIDTQAEHGYVKHQELSQKLADFAIGVQGIIEKHQGA